MEFFSFSKKKKKSLKICDKFNFDPLIIVLIQFWSFKYEIYLILVPEIWLVLFDL